MARRRLIDRLRTPPVPRAMMSPLGILAAGAGAAVGIVVGLPLVAAAGIGVAAWGARVAVAVPRDEPTRKIEPFSLRDPWRSYVVATQVAKTRFDGVVDDMDAGPLRDRLAAFDDRLADGVDESWRIAKRGDDISTALDRLDSDRPRRELQRRMAALDGAEPAADEATVIQALQSQIDAAERLETTRDDAQRRLQVLEAQFEELVARAVEVSVGTADSDRLGNDVDGLVTELEAVRGGDRGDQRRRRPACPHGAAADAASAADAVSDTRADSAGGTADTTDLSSRRRPTRSTPRVMRRRPAGCCAATSWSQLAPRCRD